MLSELVEAILQTVGVVALVGVVLLVTIKFFGYRRRSWLRESESGEAESEEFVPQTAAARVFHRRPVALVLFGTALLLVGIGLDDRGYKLFLPTSEYSSKFLIEFGFALIIAFFITMGIEAYARESHNHNVLVQIERIKKNVFEAIYKQNHDPKLIDFVDQNIFRYPFYRQNYSVQMKIIYINNNDVGSHFEPTNDDPVQIGVTLKTEVTNISSSDHDYEFETFIEKPYLRQYSDRARLLKLVINGKIVPPPEPDDEDPDFKIYKHKLRIERKTTSTLEAEFVMIKFSRDELSWRSVDPTGRFYISVDHPPGIHVFGTPIHKDTSISPKISAGAMFEILIQEPLFPHNGALVWWAPQSLAEDSRLQPSRVQSVVDSG
jgi:hypothetical protein